MLPDDDTTVEREERAVYAIIVIALAPVLIALVLRGGIVDSGSTLCLFLAVAALGGIMLAGRLRARRGVPRARVYRRGP